MSNFEWKSTSLSPVVVSADQDRFGEYRGLGVSVITFKVMPKNNQDIFIIENTFHQKGGPARHLHHEQEEWFYIVEGEFLMQIGQENFRLNPGDSVLAPQKFLTSGHSQVKDAAGS